MNFVPGFVPMFTPMLIISTLVFSLVYDIQAEDLKLLQDEVNSLHEIAAQVGKKDWNISLNPCDGNLNCATPFRSEMSFYDNTVVCNCTYPGGVCHVIHIVLKGQDLDGVLPPSLAKLPYIKKIVLDRNYLSGSIPPEWASTKLQNLSISVNRVSGRIPTFLGNITSLVYMSLENNMFYGTVPPELGKLINLKSLILSANNLSGELPLELNGLTNLTELVLSSNNFTGKIPSLGSWIKLLKLEILASGLEGPIPASISQLNNLEKLTISDLYGQGSLFPNLSRMTSMKKLMLRSCNITGMIPDYLSQMSHLRHLDLSFNKLEGDIPDLKGLDVEKLYLTGNSLNGSVPAWIYSGDTTHDIDLSYNKFKKETVPPYCRETLNLFRSYIDENDQDLGKCLGRYPCLKEYYSVHINCGGPRTTIGNTIYEADQDSGGPAKFVPSRDYWGTSSTGNIWGRNDTLADYTITNVSVLTMNDSELYTASRLSPLCITYYGRCLANGNYTVTLHFAEIVFRDNRSFQSLGRRLFDVYVQGELKLKNFDIQKEAGGVDKAVIQRIKNVPVTKKTLEIRFQYVAKGTTATPNRGSYGALISAISMEPEFKPPIHGKKNIFIVIGVVAGGLCLSLIVLCIAWYLGYIGDQASKKKDLRGLDLQTSLFTYRQIRAATDNFSASNKLGEGGFGSVYKGTLLDGSLIAVKQLSSTSKQGNREFVNEIGMITGIQHPNVVRLHGCCVEHNQLLLVYEYMENNSLNHALFAQDNAKLTFNWSTRQNICIGIAKGLAFLHEESVLRMVHRDIKASNVLLDTNLTPKISDFGLAKLHEDDNTHISTKPAGTIGYMAPEYASSGQLTYKADVYSFGVLALEIVAGTNNWNHKPSEGYFCLLDRVSILKQKGTLLDLVDPRLGSDFNKEEALRMIKIALLCTNQSPDVRPSMCDVVNMLQGRTKVEEPNMTPTTYHDAIWSQAFREDTEEICLYGQV